MASWIPHPLEHIYLVVERSDCFHAQAVNSHRSPFPTHYPRISLCCWTTLGYYPKPISLTDLPYLPEYVDPRCPSRQWLRLVSWWVTRWVFSQRWCGARDKAPHTTTPILRVTTNEPQIPGTGHKKIKIRHLPMDKLTPPPPTLGPWPTGTPAGNRPNSRYPQRHGGKPQWPHVPYGISVLRTEK